MQISYFLKYAIIAYRDTITKGQKSSLMNDTLKYVTDEPKTEKTVNSSNRRSKCCFICKLFKTILLIFHFIIIILLYCLDMMLSCTESILINKIHIHNVILSV